MAERFVLDKYFTRNALKAILWVVTKLNRNVAYIL